MSKAWGLISRFSEDIDLALDRKFLGFEGELSNSQIRKLRKESCAFVENVFCAELQQTLAVLGADGIEIKVKAHEAPDTDPLTIEVYYPSLTESIAYLQPRVLIEISARSLIEPFEHRTIQSFVYEYNSKQEFAPPPIEIPTVKPTRTFLEKLFLLHEEFQKPDRSKIKSERMSRHLYDINRIQESEHLNKALEDQELYKGIVKHRSTFTPIKSVEYKMHAPKTLKFVPPADVIKEWEHDYALMAENMFYGDVKPFEALMKSLNTLQEQINQLEYTIEL